MASFVMTIHFTRKLLSLFPGMCSHSVLFYRVYGSPLFSML